MMCVPSFLKIPPPGREVGGETFGDAAGLEVLGEVDDEVGLGAVSIRVETGAMRSSEREAGTSGATSESTMVIGTRLRRGAGRDDDSGWGAGAGTSAGAFRVGFFPFVIKN